MTSDPNLSAGWKRDLVILTALLALLFGFMLGSHNLWTPDEGRYAEIPREMLASEDIVTPRLDGVKYFEKPPLMYWIEASTIDLLGYGEWALRLPLALSALLGCLVVYGAGRRLFSRRTGLIAAAILATSPLYYMMARVLTLDMLVSVLISSALLSFLVGVQEPPGAKRRWLLWAFYTLAALAVLTKGLIGVVLPGLIIGCWILLIKDWRLLTTIHLRSGIAIFLVIVVPWHVLVARANPEFPYFYFIHEHFLRYTTTTHGRYQPPWFFIPVLIVGLFPWIAFLVHALRSAWPTSWRARVEQRETLFLLLWAVLVFAFFSASGSKLVPYILPVFPPLALLIARWLDTQWERPVESTLRIGLLLLLIFSIAIAAAFAILPWHMPQHPYVAQEATRLGAGLYLFCAMLLAVGLLPWLFGKGRYPQTIAALLVSNAMLWSIVSLELPKFDPDQSVKPLALELRERLSPGDEVMSYHDYYQDLPYYLRQFVTVVDYKGELAFGVKTESRVRQWMIDDTEFWHRWLKASHAYMVTTHKDYETLIASGRGIFRLLGVSGDNVLLANY